MAMTFGQAKKALSIYYKQGGSCPTAEGMDLFVIKVLQHMLYSGQYGNLRRFCFNAIKGSFTVPYELEVPLKVKIDGDIGTAWDKWFEWHIQNDMDKCWPAGDALREDPNYYPTVYDLPLGGARVGAKATCDEDDDAHILVQGEDTSGRVVYTDHAGEQVPGEYLRLIKGQLRYTQVTFGKITNILKTKTKGYVQLHALQLEKNLQIFLSDYAPVEENPQYRRFKITSQKCNNCIKVSVLGRIRLKPAYLDNDFIPFDNMYALDLAGQMMNSNFNNDVQTAAAKEQTLQEVITKENEYKRVQNGQPIEVFKLTSAGNIRNIIS